MSPFHVMLLTFFTQIALKGKLDTPRAFKGTLSLETLRHSKDTSAIGVLRHLDTRALSTLLSRLLPLHLSKTFCCFLKLPDYSTLVMVISKWVNGGAGNALEIPVENRFFRRKESGASQRDGYKWRSCK